MRPASRVERWVTELLQGERACGPCPSEDALFAYALGLNGGAAVEAHLGCTRCCARVEQLLGPLDEATHTRAGIERLDAVWCQNSAAQITRPGDDSNAAFHQDARDISRARWRHAPIFGA